MEVLDPLRRKMVPLTPEEKVRQWFIRILLDEAGVPGTLMRSEVAFSFGEYVPGLEKGGGRKKYRADIVVYDRSLRPLMCVECKRPEVEIGEEAIRQALRYNMVLDVRWIVLTNGCKTLIFKRNADKFEPQPVLPAYKDF